VDRFVNGTEVSITVGSGLRVHYTLDGSEPTLASPRGPVSEVVQREFVKLTQWVADELPGDAIVGGLRASQWTGAFEQVPEPLLSSQAATDLGRPGDLRMTEARRAENQCIEQSGWLQVPATGLYQFALRSDDGLHGAATDAASFGHELDINDQFLVVLPRRAHAFDNDFTFGAEFAQAQGVLAFFGHRRTEALARNA
jgi:chitobiase/beta-hexosaminidase-like protein